jgi:hypothetical protein
VKPSVYLSPTAHTTSSRPATINSVQALLMRFLQVWQRRSLHHGVIRLQAWHAGP